MKKHNFSVSPSTLPHEVIKETVKATLDFNSSDLSVLEVSCRDKDFQTAMDETVALFKGIPNIPEEYSVFFLDGDASMQFRVVSYNFLEKKAAYLSTGVRAKKVMKGAKGFGEVVEVASLAGANYTFIPEDSTIPADADYFHMTTSNTVYDTELEGDLNSPIPIVVDMSSDIFSCPIDVSKYIRIYGGTRRNLAPSGVTFIIVKGDTVGKVLRYIPSMSNYKAHIDGGSMFSVPPVLPIYSTMQTLCWIKAQGGAREMGHRATERADMLYAEMNRNKMFVGTATREDHSHTNICFVMALEYKDPEADLLKFATDKGMSGTKGYRSVGGFHVSCYDATSKESVQTLVDYVQEFEKLH